MANRYITGEKCLMAWQSIATQTIIAGSNVIPAGPLNMQAGAVTVLSIKGMNVDEDCVIADVSHTRSASRTARIAGKGDHKGKIDASFDLDAKPYFAAPNLRAGNIGIVALGFDPQFPIQVPSIVTKIGYVSTVENEVKYSFEFAENIFAGVIVYPAS